MTLSIRHGVAALLIAAVALVVAALAPRPAAAQISGDAGVTIAPAFLHYLDVDPVCCPASVWGAVGSGRWRAHVDYLRHARGHDGARDQRIGAWRFLEGNGARAALLFGANMRRGIRHQVGAALDWPMGHRFFVRVDARLILVSRRDRGRDRLLNQAETQPLLCVGSAPNRLLRPPPNPFRRTPGWLSSTPTSSIPRVSRPSPAPVGLGLAADVLPRRLIHPPRTADERPLQPGATPYRSTSPIWPCSPDRKSGPLW